MDTTSPRLGCVLPMTIMIKHTYHSVLCNTKELLAIVLFYAKKIFDRFSVKKTKQSSTSTYTFISLSISQICADGNLLNYLNEKILRHHVCQSLLPNDEHTHYYTK